jgi:DNA topoisomerase IA
VERGQARAIADKCAGKAGTVSEESAFDTEPAALRLDEPGARPTGRLAFGAYTLSLAQALYEKHKVLTHPRTDARALPEDYIDTVKGTLKELGETNAFGGFARNPDAEMGAMNKRIFDNSKISDHFAIIPTQSRRHLNEIETKLYDLVARRFSPSTASRDLHRAHHARRVRAEDGRAHPRVAGLARRVREGGARRRGVARAGEARREGRDREDRRGAARHPCAAAVERSHAAVRDGRRR